MRKGLEEGQTSLPPKGVLQTCNVFGLRAFLAFTYFKCHFLTFEKCSSTAGTVDGTEVYKYVCSTIVLLDKTIPFFFVKPFNATCN